MTHLISIAGGSGSGKTTLAKKLIEPFNGEIYLLSMDNFYKDLSQLSQMKRATTNFDHPNSIGWEDLRRCLTSMINGEETKIPNYCFETHTRQGETIVPVSKLIILEGIFALYDEKINQLTDLRLYVDADADLRFARRLKRDVEERGRTNESVNSQWFRTVKPMHDEFIEPTKRNADLIIPEDPDGNMRERAIDLLKSKIEQLII